MTLSPIQLAFDAAVKEMGDALFVGIANLGTIEDAALVYSLRAIRDIFNGALFVEGQHIVGDAPHDPFYLDYIESKAPAARTFKDAEHSFIGVTVPFVLDLWGTTGRVSQSDAVVARIGVPVGYDRVAVHRALFFMLLGFVLGHEVTHRTHGHWIPVPTARNMLPVQARELDADGWATTMTLNNYLLESGRPLAVEFLNLEGKSRTAQDDVITASFFVAHATSLFVHVPGPVDVGRLFMAPHPTLAVRHDMVSRFALKFMDDNRPSLRATMTTPRYHALMNDLSHLLWTPAHRERWQEHHRFLGTSEGQAYYTAVVRELDDFREVLRKWQAEAEQAAKAPN